MSDLTLREQATIAFSEVILTGDADLNKLDQKLLRLREILEEWHEVVLLGETK